MQSRNPVLSRDKAFSPGGYATFGSAPRGGGPAAQSGTSLEDLYAQPSAGPAQTGRMTYDDVVIRTAGMLGVLAAAGVATWVLVPPPLLVAILLPAVIVGAVLGIVNAVKREPVPALMLAYAVIEGVALGGISKLFNDQYNGIVVQAVLATVVTFGVMLALYRSRVIRVTPRFQKVLLGAVIGYAVFSLINFVLAITGVGNLRVGMLGLLIGAVGVVLAALVLTLDFDFIERGVNNGIPQQYAWTAAFGLVLTLVWLYIEFLRIFAILRGE